MSEEQEQRTEILALSIDPFEDIDRMVARIVEEQGGEPPDYTFLTDPGNRVIDRYGLRNEDSDRGIPHPTVFVIDRDGVVRWKFVEKDYKIRPTNEMILEALAEVQEEG